MKSRFLTYLLVLILAACSYNSDKAIIDKSQSLLQTYPDSSLSLLRRINPNVIKTRRLKAKYALYMSAALDKNYIDVASDSLICQAIEYYYNHGDTYEQMLTWYYNGIIHSNTNELSSAVVSFEKAAKKAEELGDYRYLGLINRNIAYSFYKTSNIGAAINSCKKAISCFEKNPSDSLYLYYEKYSLAVAYYTNEDYDNAFQITRQLMNSPLFYKDPFSMTLYAKIAIWGQDDYAGGISSYNTISDQYFSFGDCSSLAFAFNKIGKQDSSNIWLNHAYSLAKNEADSATIDYTKSKILLQRGRTEEAYHLLNHATMVQDSLTRVLLGESVSAAQRDYFREEAKRQEEKLVLTRKLSILLGVIGLLIAVFFLFVLTQQSRKKDQALKEIMAQLAIKNQHLTQLSRENASLLATHYSERIRHIDSIAREYYQADSKNQKDIVFKQFKDYIGGLANDASFYESIENDLNKYCSGLMSKVRSQLPNRPERNYRLLMLFFAGLSYETIAIITKAQSINSLKTMRSRLRKFIEESSAPDKTLFLEMLETKRRPGVI